MIGTIKRLICDACGEVEREAEVGPTITDDDYRNEADGHGWTADGHGYDYCPTCGHEDEGKLA